MVIFWPVVESYWIISKCTILELKLNIHIIICSVAVTARFEIMAKTHGSSLELLAVSKNSN